jgi:deazaflavin-dependent oxidoreductase (nitroreductase family)
MPDAPSPAWLARHADDDFCYLTTHGRRSDNSHTIEIWFGVANGTLYLLSGGRDRADWVCNLRADPSVQVRIQDETYPGTARELTDPAEDTLARELLVAKYTGRGDDPLEDWGRTSLPIAIDFPST